MSQAVLPRSTAVNEHIESIRRRYPAAILALLVLVVATSLIQLSSLYASRHYAIVPAAQTHLIPVKPLRGPNTMVKTSDLDQTLTGITGQPLNLIMGQKTVAVSGQQIKDWLEIVKKPDVTYIHVKQDAVTQSLEQLAKPYVKAPLNQVSIPDANGAARVIAAGRDGARLGDTKTVSDQISRDLLGVKGMQLTMPIETLPFAAVTPAAFDKMIEVNVAAKQMYLWQNGQLQKTYPISAGAPATPTPLGQYKIYSKLTSQDMRGYNADGTKYFQPHVPWVNYFLPGGYAIHGVYWHPASWFGAINSSHGCAGLMDYQAKEVYDWAPLGTTVITHA